MEDSIHFSVAFTGLYFLCEQYSGLGTKDGQHHSHFWSPSACWAYTRGQCHVCIKCDLSRPPFWSFARNGVNSSAKQLPLVRCAPRHSLGRTWAPASLPSWSASLSSHPTVSALRENTKCFSFNVCTQTKSFLKVSKNVKVIIYLKDTLWKR